MERTKGLSSAASLRGVALIAAGLLFAFLVSWWRLTPPSEPSGNEEIAASLAELKSVLERDEAVAQEALLRLDLSRPSRLDVTMLRNASNFWEPAFRRARPRMRRR